ncbi:hypothetical protein [Streptomyces sp. 3214.6]|uniref:hypothetical protein n=1 Tax=Streptomyces sp. 3214.6 TaxID=1882757 RepID=UPI00090C2BEF|nr:hypothetical protein [Streptomyces sp. 3214.6]SHH28825.1 hypothetical protein SAMN05444521_0005 [Streptomyces sp. 3214.6]
MYSPPPSDDDAKRMAAALAHAAAALGATIQGPQTWGWHGRTLSHRAVHPEHGACWLRLLSVPEHKAGGKLWEGTERAHTAFPTVRKPPLHALHDHIGDGYAYRTELTAYIDEPVLSPDPVLRHELDLTNAWFATIRTTLSAIAATPTDRTAVRQQWISRAVPEYTGQPAPQIQHWDCAHGDFHAANLTQDATVLDWEGWGLAPPAATTSPCSTPTPNSPRALPHTSEGSSPRSWTAQQAGRLSSWSAPSYCSPPPVETTPSSPPSFAHWSIGAEGLRSPMPRHPHGSPVRTALRETRWRRPTCPAKSVRSRPPGSSRSGLIFRHLEAVGRNGRICHCLLGR